MKNNNEMVFQFPIEQIATAVAEKIQHLFTISNIEPTNEEKFLTRKEAAKMLNISLPTLSQYTKKRILVGYRVGVRVLYKKSEIDLALTQIKYGRD